MDDDVGVINKHQQQVDNEQFVELKQQPQQSTSAPAPVQVESLKTSGRQQQQQVQGKIPNTTPAAAAVPAVVQAVQTKEESNTTEDSSIIIQKKDANATAEDGGPHIMANTNKELSNYSPIHII